MASFKKFLYRTFFVEDYWSFRVFTIIFFSLFLWSALSSVYHFASVAPLTSTAKFVSGLIGNTMMFTLLFTGIFGFLLKKEDHAEIPSLKLMGPVQVWVFLGFFAPFLGLLLLLELFPQPFDALLPEWNLILGIPMLALGLAVWTVKAILGLAYLFRDEQEPISAGD